jgi:hypothetical protein
MPAALGVGAGAGIGADVLVYNAALAPHRSIVDLSAEHQLAAWAVNARRRIHRRRPPRSTHGPGGARDHPAHRPDARARPGAHEPIPRQAAVRALTGLLATAYGPSGIHAATAFDSDAIAEHYWRLHAQPADAWEHEAVFASEPSPQPDQGRTP